MSRSVEYPPPWRPGLLDGRYHAVNVQTIVVHTRWHLGRLHIHVGFDIDGSDPYVALCTDCDNYEVDGSKNPQ